MKTRSLLGSITSPMKRLAALSTAALLVLVGVVSLRAAEPEAIDPAHFIKVTNSKGGVAPEEIARMIADRREKLAEARARHLKRIETLETAQKCLVADLKAAAQTPNEP